MGYAGNLTAFWKNRLALHRCADHREKFPCLEDDPTRGGEENHSARGCHGDWETSLCGRHTCGGRACSSRNCCPLLTTLLLSFRSKSLPGFRLRPAGHSGNTDHGHGLFGHRCLSLCSCLWSAKPQTEL